MLKNREFVISLLLQCVVLVAAVLLYGIVEVNGMVIIAVSGGLLILIHVIYTRYRYQEMRKLSSYITSFSYGNERLDLMDNREGELSILKNELYKLCLKLLQQQELLKKDKTFLANSISDISHQLKTPLTSMMVMADLLQEDNLSEEKREEFTHNIQNGLERMNWLVQSLLKSAKLDAGSVMLKQETVRVKDLIQSACKSFLIPMDLKNQSLIMEGDEDVTILCDRAWTVEAISNIVKNCMEHTKENGTIKIQYEENTLYSSIVIEDTGVGIAKEDLPYIFKRFYRGKNSSMDSVGIGLALSRQILILQKATIDVTSTEGVGTKFLIKFYR